MLNARLSEEEPSLPRRSFFPGPGLALFSYTLLTVLLTWPLILHLGDGLPAGDNDLWQNYWNFWWWKTVLGRGQLPYTTDLIYQPGSASLAFHTHSEANILLTLPLSMTCGVPCALNTATLLGFVLAGWGGYFLARELVRDPRAAFVAGAVLAFFPHRFEQSLEHLNLASYQAMPFFLFFLIRLARRGGRRNIILGAFFYALNSLYSWHNGLIILPTALLLFARELLRPERPRPKILLDAAVSGALAALILFPFAWPMLREILAGETYYLKPMVKKGIDPFFLLVPSEHHPIWGGIFAGLYERLRGYASVGFTCYLGIAPLLLWIAGARRNEGASGASSTPAEKLSWSFWSLLFLLHLLLAMGDPLTIAGKETSVRLPFALVRGIPFIETIRVANRFMVPAMLALSVLTAWGARRLIAGRKTQARARAAFLVVLGAVLVDYLWVPYPVAEVPRLAWTQEVRKAPPGLLLDIPGGYRARGAEDMFLQTLHGRPTVGGYASCVPPFMENRVEAFPFLKIIFEGQPSIDVDIEGGLKEVLSKLEIGVVVVHLQRTRERLERLSSEEKGKLFRRHNPEKGMPEKTLEAIRAALRRLWGEPYYHDEEVEVYGRPS